MLSQTIFEYSRDTTLLFPSGKDRDFGGYNAMRGHGGITARLIQGLIKVDDKVWIDTKQRRLA